MSEKAGVGRASVATTRTFSQLILKNLRKITGTTLEKN
jgi:hypothetical protein